MSLRLWSDEVALPPLLATLGFEAEVIHARGMPISSEGPLATRIARRHSASVEREPGARDADIDAWVESVLATLAAKPGAVALMRFRQVEAVFWIALFGSVPLPTPQINADIAAVVASLGAAILIENYTDLEEGNPRKVWLPTKPASA